MLLIKIIQVLHYLLSVDFCLSIRFKHQSWQVDLHPMAQVDIQRRVLATLPVATLPEATLPEATLPEAMHLLLRHTNHPSQLWWHHLVNRISSSKVVWLLLVVDKIRSKATALPVR